jgi:nicotinate-nucleotide--dimethylbenzimidazole phosphoribosyltransferase
VTTSEPDFDLHALAARITEPDAQAHADALARQDTLTKPTGALGRLEELSAWLASVAGSCPPPPITKPTLVIFAGDHGAARTAGTSAYPPEVTAQMVANFMIGGAAANVLARSRGVAVHVVDVSVDIDWDRSGLPVPPEVSQYRIRRGSGSIDREDACTSAQAAAALALGSKLAADLAAGGADLLIAGDMGIGNTTAAAALVGLLAGLEPAEVVGRGTGIDDLTWRRKLAVVREAMRRGRRHVADPVRLLSVCGAPDLAATTGFLLGAAAAGVPVLLDGVISATCALVGQQICQSAPGWWQASHRSTEPAAVAALAQLGKEPLLDLGMRLGEGTGALLALPIVTAAGDLLREMATFSGAGVSNW